MLKRDYIVTLVAIAALSGVPAISMAQANNQKGGSQQQAATHKQTSNTESASSGDARRGKEMVGGGGRDYLIAAQLPSQVLSSSLIGMTIRNKAEEIGTISNLILNKKYKLMGFVVDMSGTTGLINKSVGISWEAVRRIDLKEGFIMVDIKKAKLQTVESYTSQQELQ